jgi:beta-glucosidase
VKRADDGGLDVSFRLRNSGGVASDEVPQVYLAAPSQPPQGRSSRRVRWLRSTG